MAGVVTIIVEDGDRVRVHYEGKFEDGEVFDSTYRTKSPLEFEVGAPNILPAFSQSVKEMEVGTERTIFLDPSLAYGKVDPGLIFDMNLSGLPVEGTPRVDELIQVRLKEGLAVTGRITAVKGDSVTIDLNHPLSGRTLLYKIELIEVLSKRPGPPKG